MAAYGLYTHIASNKMRSMLLLVGLFFLVYVMVFAGALLALDNALSLDLVSVLYPVWQAGVAICLLMALQHPQMS